MAAVQRNTRRTHTRLLGYVYCHVDPIERRLLYVGVTIQTRRYRDVLSRSIAHREHVVRLLDAGVKLGQICHRLCRPVAIDLAERLEREVIKALRPPYNYVHNLSVADKAMAVVPAEPVVPPLPSARPCLDHLLSWGGPTIRALLKRYQRGPEHEYTARRALWDYGLDVRDFGDGPALVVANSHPGLTRVFAGTPWSARQYSVDQRGQCSFRGRWAILLLASGAAWSPRKHHRFGQAIARCVAVPLAVVMD